MIFVSVITSIIVALIEISTFKRKIVFIPYLFIVPVLVLLPYIIFKKTKTKEFLNKKWLEYMGLFSFLIIALNAPGSLFLHKLGWQYDRIVHIGDGIISFFIALLIFLLIEKIFKKYEIRKNRIIIFSFITILIGLFAYEGLQYGIDKLFHTELFFDVKQNIKTDFTEDVLFSFIGLIFSVIYVYYFSFNKFLSVLRNYKNME